MMGRLVVCLLISCGCGKLVSGPPDASSTGAACRPDAGSAINPPACNASDLDAATATCAAWASNIVEGGVALCSGGACFLALGQECTPGSAGDAFCEAWFQTFTNAHAHGACQPQGPADPSSVGFQCVAAEGCAIENGHSLCLCGSQAGCSFNAHSLCVDDTTGSPTCAPWCQ